MFNLLKEADNSLKDEWLVIVFLTAIFIAHFVPGFQMLCKEVGIFSQTANDLLLDSNFNY